MLKAGKYTHEDIADLLQMTVDEVKTLDEKGVLLNLSR